MLLPPLLLSMQVGCNELQRAATGWRGGKTTGETKTAEREKKKQKVGKEKQTTHVTDRRGETARWKWRIKETQVITEEEGGEEANSNNGADRQNRGGGVKWKIIVGRLGDEAAAWRRGERRILDVEKRGIV
jgi:hypothetical protein